jgi:large subunit ribosomal protein L25
MAKQVKLSAQTRPGLGRAAVRKIKQNGLVPAVMYGIKKPPVHLQLSARDVKNVLSHATGEHFLVELEIGDGDGAGNHLALIQEVQHHPLRGDVLHVDFHAVSADEKLHASVPIETTGEAFGVKNGGGLLEVPMHSLDVECFPRDLPDVIRLDVSHLKLGEAIHIRDIQLPEGVVVRGDQDLTVVRVAEPTVAEAATPGLGEVAAQPEVLKEKKPDADAKESK